MAPRLPSSQSLVWRCVGIVGVLILVSIARRYLLPPRSPSLEHSNWAYFGDATAEVPPSLRGSPGISVDAPLAGTPNQIVVTDVDKNTLVFGRPGSGDHGPEPTFKGLTIDYGRAPPPPPPGAGTLTIDLPQSPHPTNGQIPIGTTGGRPRWADLTLSPMPGGCIIQATEKGVERRCG